MHLKSIPILPEQLGVPGGDQRLNLRGSADREGPTGRRREAVVQRGRGVWRREAVVQRGRRGAWGAGEMVGICLAVVGWQIPTTFKRYSAEKRSRNARLPQPSKSRPFWEAQQEEARQKENHQKEAPRKETHQKEAHRKETQQKKGAADGDPCRCDELFAWHAATPPQAPPRRAPQRTPRPQRARCRDTPSLPGWTRRTWPHR